MISCDEAFDDLSGEEISTDTTELLGLEGTDSTLFAASLPYVGLLAVLVLLYVALHYWCKEIFYTNPLRRQLGPAPPARGWYGFADFAHVIAISDEDFEHHCGLDAFVSMLLVRMSISIFSIFGIFGILLAIVYLLAYYTAPEQDQAQYPAGNIGRISLVNVVFNTDDNQEPGAVAAVAFSVIGAYLLTFLVCYQLRKYYFIVIARRVAAFTSAANINGRVVLVQNPVLSAEISSDAARALWDRLYPDEVLDVCMIQDTGRLPKLLPKHDKLVRRLELLEAKDADGQSGWCDRRKNADLVDEHRSQLRFVERQMRAEHKRRLSRDTGRCYLVLFRSYRAANSAKQVRIGGTGASKVVAAPLPDDLNYNVLEPDESKKNQVRGVVGSATFWLIFFFYSAPIALVSFLVSFEKNEWIQDVTEDWDPTLRAFLEGLLPSLLLTIFLSFLPSICMSCAASHAPAAKSKISFGAFVLLFRFNLTWSFIGIALGSSALVLFSVIQCVAEKDITAFLTEIGSQLSKNALFFCIYITLQITLTLPLLELNLILVVLKEKFCKAVGLMREHEVPDEPMPYTTNLARLMLVMLIGIAYAVISPITIFFSLVYCIEAYLLHGRNLLYVYNPKRWPGQGNLWPEISEQIFIILIISHILIFAVHAVIESLGALFILPLPLIVLWFRSFVRREYQPRLSVISLTKAINADDGCNFNEEALINDFRKAYSQPEFDLPPFAIETGAETAGAA